MTSTIKVNTIQDSCGSALVAKCSSTITLGASGKTIALATGASQTGFGRTGTVDWCTTAKTSPFTAVNGKGYFVNTTSGGITVTLPSSPSAGDIVAFSDYANQWDTNGVTLCRNSSLINGGTANTTLSKIGSSITLVYVDGTRGWKQINDATENVTGSTYITATGGTITNSPCGNYKVHTFNSDATFTVTQLGNSSGSSTVEYLVVAGGGGGGADSGGGGGAGGTRYNFPSPTSGGFTVTAGPTAYPITVGGGGAGATEPGSGSQGSTSTFSTISSAGGGSGSGQTPVSGGDGGSGGGGRKGGGSGGSGNTPPVSPSQGTDGGSGNNPGGPKTHTSGSGGGACNAGQNATDSPGPTTQQFTVGGDGKSFPTAAWGSSGDTQPGGQFFGGGGGSGQGGPSGSGNTPYDTPLGNGGKGGGGSGGDSPGPGSPTAQVYGRAGTANTGGGGGGGAEQCASGPPARNGGAGGSGIVILRYKFQN